MSFYIRYLWEEKDFNYLYDAIVYSVFIFLGFASIENLIVILSNGEDLILAIQRVLITVIAYVFLGIISRYFLRITKKYLMKSKK